MLEFGLSSPIEKAFFYIGSFSHEMDVIHRISTFSNAKFKEVDHWVDPTFFDVWIFTEVIIGFE